MISGKFRIALAQYPIEFHQDFTAYERKVTSWCEEAAGQGASLLVFPEYGTMELVSLLPEDVRSDLKGQIDALQDFWPRINALHAGLARDLNVHILGASFPLARKNAATLYAPNGKSGTQEKAIMTRFEREQWGIEAGGPLRVFKTALGTIGITICYDSEFPLLARALAESGAGLILAPSCTEALAGYSRVRIGSQARALENQCYVAQSPTVGDAPWSLATDKNYGAAALYGPPDLGFPADGIVVQGELNKPCWVYGEVDLKRVARVRKSGAVFNYAHWNEQGGEIVLPEVEQIDLS